MTTTETIYEVRQGSGFDLDQYITRVFKSRETAHKYQNGLDHNVTILVVSAKVRTGERLPMGTLSHTLSSEYQTRSQPL